MFVTIPPGSSSTINTRITPSTIGSLSPLAPPNHDENPFMTSTLTKAPETLLRPPTSTQITTSAAGVSEKTGGLMNRPHAAKSAPAKEAMAPPIVNTASLCHLTS